VSRWIAIGAVLLGSLIPAGGAVARTRVLVALGDSLAAPDGSYVDRLSAHLREPGRWQVDRVVKLAVPAETSGSILHRQLRAAKRAIRRRSDVRVVTVDIGGNDGLSGIRCALDPAAPPCPGRACLDRPGLVPCRIRPHLDVLLTTVRRVLRRDPGREVVVLMGLPNPWSGTGSPIEPIVDRGLLGDDNSVACVPPSQQGLDDLYACAAGRHAVRFVNVYPAFAGRGLELTNIAFGDYHFNAAGHTLAAALLLRALRPHR
jgi:lysophospholipase L1-like esterase